MYNTREAKNCTPTDSIAANACSRRAPVPNADAHAKIIHKCETYTSCLLPQNAGTPSSNLPLPMCRLGCFVDRRSLWLPTIPSSCVNIERELKRGYRWRNAVRHCFENGSASPSQLRPTPSHPVNRITKSPSLYVPSGDASSLLLYAFNDLWGTRANFERIVGCHCTICSFGQLVYVQKTWEWPRQPTKACVSAFWKL